MPTTSSNWNSGYRFPILDSTGAPSTTVEDLSNMFVRYEDFLASQLWTCGYNPYGQLGNNATTNYSSPIQVGILTNWKQVAGGYYHTVAIKTDGSLWSFGYNPNGQLGNNTGISYSSPIQVGTLTNWKQVACGYAYTTAIADGYF